MPLFHHTTSSSRRIYEAYEPLAEGDATWTATARLMLEFLPELETLCVDRPVWAVLSHFRPCMVSRDDFRSRPHVVGAVAQPGFTIRYLMHPDDAPWPRAEFVGETDSTARAAELVEIAMDRSGGWSEEEPRIQELWRESSAQFPQLGAGVAAGLG